MPARVLSKAAQDPQRCMVPLMQLESDEIIEASLLGPADDRPITPQPQKKKKKKQYSLGINLSLKKVQRLPCLPQSIPKAQNWRNQPSSPMLQVHLAFHPQSPTPKVTIPGIPGEPGIGLEHNIC